MILPKIYEDAISCFCPRTAKMMKLSINNYLTTGIIKISSRICAAPKAVLMLIFHDIHQNLKCSLTEGCSLPEEEQKELRKGINPGRKVFKKGRGQQLIYKQ